MLCVPQGAKEEARRFYGQLLGLQEIAGDHPRNAMWFEIADIQLHIREEEQGGPLSERHLAFEVGDLEEAELYLRRKGIPIAYSSDIGGRKRFFFRDPFGNRIELLYYLH